jgi:GNAT superfamily N-acetyltransferase
VKELQSITVAPALPSGGEARALLESYFHELISRYQHRPGRADEVEAAMAEYSSDDLTEPTGVFLLARKGDTVVGCIGLRVRDGRIGEVTRVFVVPSERRNGVGARLVTAIEAVARKYGVRRLELDTRDDLVEARRLYERCGFKEVPAFNTNRYAAHWFAKEVDGEGGR